ncbi:MAG: cytochrome C biogenesis protein CcmF [Meiothermus sp.]
MTPGLLGGLSLGAALLFSLIGLGLCFMAYFQRDSRYLEAARRTSGLALLAALAAFGALEWALLTDDFSVQYVAEHHSSTSPLWVKLVTPWAALEGSILLWATLQTLYTWTVSRRVRLRDLSGGDGLDPYRAPIALGVLFGVQVFFFAVMVFLAHPFNAVIPPPAEGPGPNPLLQNHWMMAVHPVLMYLGFVGFSVPFAYAVAAMVTRRYQSWVHETRWWTMIAWGFLTAGKMAGAWWSYEVLGWGGYWAWDPVENASFLPWLLATAFLHTSMVQERRGLLRSWNFSLVILTFVATFFMTFLTRSGVIQSVHAFGEGPVGPVFLAFLLSAALVGFYLLSRVSAEVRDAGEVRLISREGALLGGAILFTVLTFVVLVGTVWPLVVEALSGAKVSVGAPFFNQMAAPFGVLMLLLMGIGPVLPWRQGKPQVIRNLLILLAVLLAGTAAGLIWGWTLGVSLAVGLFLYNLAAVGLMVGQGVRERAKSLGVSAARALALLALTNKRRFGSHIVHVGVALGCLAIAFSQAYRVEAQKTVRIGETWQEGGLEVRLLDLRQVQQPNRIATIAVLDVRGTRWAEGQYRPRLNVYPVMNQPLPSPSVKYTLGNDYYFILQQFGQDQRGPWATVRVIITPLVLWLWVAGAIMVMGTLYILWPSGSRAVSRAPGGATA